MNILIIGGAGFIGSHLCESYSNNHNVTSLDNYISGKNDNHVNGVQYLNMDAKDILSLEPKYDLIFHLGEYSRVEQSFDDIDSVWEYNNLGTFQVLKFCRDNACKIIYAGSSTKFGDGGLGRFQSPYAWIKASNTELVKNFSDWFDVPYAIVYFYNAYGPREIRAGRYATLIALFAEKMRKGEPLTVVSPGKQERNFTHVWDIIRALVKIGEDGYGDGYGIGNPESFSVLEIADMFGGKIELLPKRRGNRMTADLVIDKTQALGWNPRHSIKDYIEELRSLSWRDIK